MKVFIASFAVLGGIAAFAWLLDWLCAAVVAVAPFLADSRVAVVAISFGIFSAAALLISWVVNRMRGKVVYDDNCE